MALSPSSKVCSLLLVVVLASLASCERVAAAKTGLNARRLLQAPLVKDISEFCSVQRRPFKWLTHPFEGQVQRFGQFDYCKNLYPNIGTVTGTTTETALPGGGRSVVASITAKGVFAVAGLNDLAAGGSLPLLGAAASVNDDLSKLSADEFNTVTALGDCTYVASFEEPDVAVGSPLPALLDLDFNLDDFHGVATGPIRSNSYISVAAGTPGRLTVAQVSINPPAPGEGPYFTTENVDIDVLSPDPVYQAKVQSVLAKVTKTATPAPTVAFPDPIETSAPGGTCNPNSATPNQCFDDSGTVFVCCPGQCGSPITGDPQCV